jgi:hypothetical protein
MKIVFVYIGIMLLGVALIVGSNWLPEARSSGTETIGLMLAGFGAGASLRYFS